MDTDVEKPVVISPVVHVGFPFGSIVEVAHVYPDERKDISAQN